MLRNVIADAKSSRKGLSPLIATVLLISIVVALAAIVMNWSKVFVKDTTELAQSNYDTSIACKLDISLDILEIGGMKQACISKNETASTMDIDLIVENNGRMDITGLEITLVSEEQRINTTYFPDLLIKRATPARVIINYGDLTYENISIIRITPIMEVDDGYVQCIDKVFELDGVEVVPCDML